MNIKDLQRQGVSQRQIARLTGYSRNTIAKQLSQATPKPFVKTPRKSRIDPFKPYLTERYQAYRLSAVRLLEEIRPQGYTGSINLVQRFLKTFKDEQGNKAKMTVRFETAPGQQAQADWAEVGRHEDGGKVYAFVMVLSFSRMLFVTFTRSMALPELIASHQEAFAYFGGIPSAVLYDNMAQVRKPGSGELNPLMADFATHYGFAVKTHQPYRPRTKGKVERMVDYLKDNFLNGRPFAGVDDLAAQGRCWLEMANNRLHATTGEKPMDLLARENLTPFGAAMPYVLAQRHERRVDVEGFVRLERSRYSVPPHYVGKKVIVVQREQQIEVRLGDLVIAEHRAAVAGACVTKKEHVEAMWRESLTRTNKPFPKVHFTDAETVVVRPLSLYEEVAQ